MSTVPPIRREVLVDAGPEAAFDVFTAGIGRWWPIAELSVHGGGGTVAFTGGQIVERSATGQQAVWGTVTRWEPPAAVAFTWHPGQTPDGRATSRSPSPPPPADPGHGDPHRLGRLRRPGRRAGRGMTTAGRWCSAATRSRPRPGGESGHGEDSGQKRRAAGEEGGPGEDGSKQTWVALLHRPGPAAPPDGSVFDDPRFAEHVAFLNRMRDAGVSRRRRPDDRHRG